MSVIFCVGVDEPPVTPHSIYRDIVNLPDPTKLGLTVRVFNYDDVALYMRVDGYATGYTFTTNDLGSVASGGNIYRHLDRFATRAKPSAETLESITVRLRAYTDAGYTNLKWTYERSIEVLFIKSDDGSWTQDFLNNFDDGTVQGWNHAETNLISVFWGVATDYVLSTPYSLKLDGQRSGYIASCSEEIYKSFTTPDRNRIYAIADLRLYVFWSGTSTPYIHNLQGRSAGVAVVFIGRPVDGGASNYLPTSRWLRMMMPLPRNTTVEVRYRVEGWVSSGSGTANIVIWMDDFRIISKD